MSAPKITLDQYVTECRERIEAFAAIWRAKNKLDPDHWPAEMEAGEWDEQMRAYEEIPHLFEEN